MQGVGTLMYSTVFFAVAGILVIVVCWYLVDNIWYSIIKKNRKTKPDNYNLFLIVISLIKTIVIITITIIVLTLGWNFKQKITTTMSVYKSSDEEVEQKKIQESVFPSQSELDGVATEQKEKVEVKPHQESLDFFDKRMEEEANKIYQHNTSTEKQ